MGNQPTVSSVPDSELDTVPLPGDFIRYGGYTDRPETQSLYPRLGDLVLVHNQNITLILKISFPTKEPDAYCCFDNLFREDPPQWPVSAQTMSGVGVKLSDCICLVSCYTKPPPTWREHREQLQERYAHWEEHLKAWRNDLNGQMEKAVAKDGPASALGPEWSQYRAFDMTPLTPDNQKYYAQVIRILQMRAAALSLYALDKKTHSK